MVTVIDPSTREVRDVVDEASDTLHRLRAGPLIERLDAARRRAGPGRSHIATVEATERPSAPAS